MGIGSALTFLPSITVLYHHFKRHHGLASGIALSGSSIGAAIFPIVTSSRASDSLPPSASAVPSLGHASSLATSSCAPASRQSCKIPQGQTIERVKSFFVHAPYVWGIIGFLLGFLGLYFPVVYIQLFSLQHGIDPSLAFYSVTMLNAFGTFFRLLGTYSTDVYGPFTVMVICSLGVGGMIWAMLGILLYGTFYSTWLALGFPCSTSLAKGPEEIGYGYAPSLNSGSDTYGLIDTPDYAAGSA
ncbi:MFS general substrate transporter [Mycena sanguinolenta]|uniref:MFS general substrate transporter n=1 Tax=Mycena sanguinolenta TaxID=230812 RepID=A0A8H6Z750_9AGAR|nr:MFS general substrate transporter [Mycena sanguinolenta]